jgi:hypothetical protein
MKSSVTTSTAVIPDEIERALDALPNKRTPGIPRQWQPREDEILLRYWGIKRQQDVAKILQRCIHSCLDRYRILTKTDQ